MTTEAAAEARDEGIIVKLLSVFAVVHPSEVFSVMMLTLDGILLLASYYFLKVIREPLILAAKPIEFMWSGKPVSIGGAEVKSYATAALAILLVFVFYGYKALASRVPRLKLITYTKFFCAGCLILFSLLGRAGVSVGIPFFLWVGCYSLTILAQFWAFANDIYTPEQGKRLFAIVGVGASAGALIGSLLAKMAVKPFGLFNMMLVPAGVLMVCLLIVRVVDARETGGDETKRKQAEKPPGGSGGIEMIFSEKYLVLIAAIILILNLVNTNGEYILDRTLEGATATMDEAAKTTFLGEFKAGYFFWANLFGVLLQLFLASRVFKYLDVRGALFIYPLLVLCSYTTMMLFPVLAIVQVGKIAENSLDYSIYNSAKQALWLPTSREQKYVAKQAIDTFIVRGGDLLSAGFVAAGTALAASTTQFAMSNVVLGGVWIAVVIAIGREHKKKTAAKAEEEKKSEPAAA